jgi:hypothetical protein
MKHIRAVVVALLVVLAFPVAVHAHESVFTYKHIDGENMIIVTHSVPSVQSGIPINYNVRLYNLDGTLVPFSNVHMQIKQQDRTIFETSVPISQHDDVSHDYAYPKEGTYTLAIAVLDNDKQIIAADFPVIVERGVKDSFFDAFFTIQSAVAFVLGAVVFAVVMAYRHSLRRWASKVSFRHHTPKK